MWPNERINNINSIKPYCDIELQAKLDELNTSLYGKQDKSWDGKTFLTFLWFQRNNIYGPKILKCKIEMYR